MNRLTDITLPLQVIVVGGDSSFAGLVWSSLRTIGTAYFKLTGIKLGRSVSRLAAGDQDWRDLYYELEGERPVLFVLHGVDRLEGNVIGQARGEFALIAGNYAHSPLLMGHEVGHLLGLRHTTSGFMRSQGLESGEMDTIHNSQRNTMRENAWLWE